MRNFLYQRALIRAAVLAVLVAVLGSTTSRPARAQLDLALAGGMVSGALSYDGSTIVALHGEVVTITFTVEYALGMSFPQGDEFNTLASVPVPQSNIFRKQSMSSDSPDVPCSTFGCTGRIFTGQTVTFTTTFHAENPGATTFTAGTSLNLRTESNRDNNTWSVAVEVVEAAPASDISVRIADVINADSVNIGARVAFLTLDKPATVCAWIRNTGPADANDVVVLGEASSQADAAHKSAQNDLFEFAQVNVSPESGTCVTAGSGGFTCSGISIPAGDSVKLNIEGFGIADAVGTMTIQAVSPANDDPDTANNVDFVRLDILNMGPRGFAVVPLTALTIVGQPIDFFVFDCKLDAEGRADFGPDGVPGTDDDDCVPVPFAEWLLTGDIGSIAPIEGPTSTLTPALPIGTDSAGGAIVAQYDQKNDQAVITISAPGAIHGRLAFADTEFELGVDGIAVLLLDENGAFIRQEITHSRDLNDDGVIDPAIERGLFWFENLVPGVYRIALVLTPPWMPVDVTEQEVSLGPGNIEVPVFEIVSEDDGGESAIDFGDLPTPHPDTTAVCPDAAGKNRCYQTLRVDDGAAHAIRAGLQLGTEIDGEADGVPGINADGDNIAGTGDDEDGWYLGTWPAAGGTGSVKIGVRNSTDSSAFLHMWIDIDNDGRLATDSTEYVIRGEVIPGKSGFVVVDAAFPVPQYPAFDPYVRIRLTSDVGSRTAARPHGLYLDGEVEDYYWDEYPVPGDLGDAPDESDPSRPDVPAGYPTRLQDDGARHVVTPTVRLGDVIDRERDGQPSSAADGDDTDGGFVSDDDGIDFGPGFVVVGAVPTSLTRSGFFYEYGVASGATATITPRASLDGMLDGWIDFNRDGDWDDAGEQVFDSVPVKGGPDFTPLSVTVPEAADPGFTFARFRFSLAGDLEVTGLASDGEVEDYRLRILERLAISNSADGGTGSLRDAIVSANMRNPGGGGGGAVDPILIDLSGLDGTGKTSAVITPSSPLPEITAPVVINGAGNELDGSGAGAGADGLSISGDGVVVTGLTIRNFGGHGIVLAGDGAIVARARVENNGGAGIRVMDAGAGAGGGSGNRILGTVARGNGGLGIDRGGDGATPNDVDEGDGIQNSPSITSVEITDSLRISGLIVSTPDAMFAVDLFVASACDAGESSADAYAAGTQGIVTDGNGQAVFSFVLPAPASNAAGVTTTATSATLGTSEVSTCAFATDVEAPGGDLPSDTLPTQIALHGSYPNPTRAGATIPYDLPRLTRVRIDVFDVLGRHVATLLDGDRAAGRHVANFDSERLPAGPYVYRLTTRDVAISRWLLVAR